MSYFFHSLSHMPKSHTFTKDPYFKYWSLVTSLLKDRKVIDNHQPSWSPSWAHYQTSWSKQILFFHQAFYPIVLPVQYLSIPITELYETYPWDIGLSIPAFLFGPLIWFNLISSTICHQFSCEWLYQSWQFCLNKMCAFVMCPIYFLHLSERVKVLYKLLYC